MTYRDSGNSGGGAWRNDARFSRMPSIPWRSRSCFAAC